jgi:hypothetical protein
VTACDEGPVQSLINSTERIFQSVVALSNKAIADSPLADTSERLASEARQARAIGQLTVLATTAKVKQWLNSPVVVAAPAASEAARPTAKPTVASPTGIADYANLSASQIVPLLSGLTGAERTEVFEYESATRQRKTILAALAKSAG